MLVQRQRVARRLREKKGVREGARRLGMRRVATVM